MAKCNIYYIIKQKTEVMKQVTPNAVELTISWKVLRIMLDGLQIAWMVCDGIDEDRKEEIDRLIKLLTEIETEWTKLM